MPNVNLAEARSPLAIAIDVGSSSVRSLIYDATGAQVAESEAKQSHVLRTDQAGASEADPDLLVDLLCRCLDRTLAESASRAEDIGAVGISCFWHGLMGIDGHGAAVTPVYMWADHRSGSFVPALATAYAPADAVRLTGCRMHSSYWPAKLRWLRATEPERFAAVARWISFPDYVALRLTGELVTSVSMASGTGLLGTGSTTWFDPFLELAGVRRDQLPPIIDRDEAMPPLESRYRDRWPSLIGVPWFPALGDGAAANVGAGCVGADRIALTIGTSGAMRTIVPAGGENPPGQLWSYRLDRRHKVIGGALSNGGNVTAWLAETFAARSLDDLSREAATIAPDGHGLTILPFLAGERSPSWNDNATGVFAGLKLATTPGELFRATLEATAYRFAAIHDDLKHVVTRDHAIHANGAAALGSPLWLKIISDILGHSIEALDAEAEASARGAAVCALEAIGALATLRPAVSEVVRTYVPDATLGDVYTCGRRRHQALESALSRFYDAIPT